MTNQIDKILPTKEELDNLFNHPVVIEKTADKIIESGILEVDCGDE